MEQSERTNLGSQRSNLNNSISFHMFNLVVTRHSIRPPTAGYTPLAVVSRARKTLPVSTTTATIAQVPVVSSKEGVVLGTRKFHRGHHWHQTHMNNCRINEISNKLVLSGVFNTRIFDTMNYANQDYMHVNYTQLFTLCSIKKTQLFTLCSIKKRLIFLPGYGPIAIADWPIIVQCHLLVNHGFSVYWCSRWNGHIEYIETTAYGV
jgi:hypothetical protein